MVVKAYFLQNEGEEAIVKQRKELCNVKSESTCWQDLDPTCLNDVYKRYTHIYCGFEL